MTANEAWLEVLGNVLSRGKRVSPREQPCREILCNQSRIDMSHPVLTVIQRKLGYRFLAAEAWWILSGRNDVESISPYSSAISKFSDDGTRFDGAYGPKVVDQLRYVVDCLSQDFDSRQAVVEIWRPNPRQSKDVPCTLSAQWFIRDGKLHCSDTMRSSDVWLGWPYDMFNFTCLSALILLELRRAGLALGLGDLTLTAGSQHIYDRDLPKIERVLEDPSCFKVPAFSLAQFANSTQLVKHLEEAKDNAMGSEEQFVADILTKNLGVKK